MKNIPVLIFTAALLWTLSYSVFHNLANGQPAPHTDYSGTSTLIGVVYEAPDSQAVLHKGLIGLYLNDKFVASRTTDVSGQFEFNNLAQADYQIKIFTPRFGEMVQDITVDREEIKIWIGVSFKALATREPELEVLGSAAEGKTAEEVTLDAAVAPVDRAPTVELDHTVGGHTLGAEDIKSLSTRHVSSIAATTAGVSSVDEGEVMSSAGSRGKSARKRVRKGSSKAPKLSKIDVVEEKIEEIEPETERKEPSPDAGQLTAGVISDHNDWNTWKDVVQKTLVQHANHWQLYPTHRYLVQVVNQQRVPLPNLVVRLQKADGTTIWESRTDNTGRAELWNQLHTSQAKATQRVSIVVEKDGFSQTVKAPVTYDKGPNQVVFSTSCQSFNRVDIAWVIDATGSMSDEISYLQAELSDVINRSQLEQPDITFEQAAVFYRDQSDAYITRHESFTEDLYSVHKFINQQSANGGGDFPEAVEEALDVAINNLNWHEDAMTKILFLVLDAPPHHNSERVKRLHALITKAAKRGIRIIPVASSGVDKSTEYFLRAIALATNGHYVFLTNHSGIGGAHIEPTASVYKVEFLNDLLTRLIQQATQPPFCNDVPLPEVDSEEIPEASESLQLLPNPASDRVRVTIPNGIKEILITDTNGRLVEHWQDTPVGTRIWRVGQYPVGIYFLHYIQDGEQKTERLVVIKS